MSYYSNLNLKRIIEVSSQMNFSGVGSSERRSLICIGGEWSWRTVISVYRFYNIECDVLIRKKLSKFSCLNPN